MKISYKQTAYKTILENLLEAQKNMASASTVDARGLIRLSRFTLHVLDQLKDECVDLSTKDDEKRS